MRPRVPLLSLALLVAALGACSPPADDRRRVLLIGDSITGGVVSGQEGPPYAELLARSLGDGFLVTNMGCAGASSLDWTRSRGTTICGALGSSFHPNLFETRVLPHLPADVVSILLGTNDAIGILEPTPVPVADYRSALEEIVGDLISHGAAQVVLMTPPGFIPQKLTAYQLVFGYRDAVLALCESQPRVRCGPDLFMQLHLKRHFHEYNVHPNARGHRLIAEGLGRAIRAATAPAEDARAPAAAAAALPW